MIHINSPIKELLVRDLTKEEVESELYYPTLNPDLHNSVTIFNYRPYRDETENREICSSGNITFSEDAEVLLVKEDIENYDVFEYYDNLTIDPTYCKISLIKYNNTFFISQLYLAGKENRLRRASYNSKVSKGFSEDIYIGDVEEYTLQRVNGKTLNEAKKEFKDMKLDIKKSEYYLGIS